MVKIVNAYIRPGSSADAAYAAARARLVEAMLTPQVPCLLGGDLIRFWRTPLLKPHSPGMGGRAPCWGFPPHRLGAAPEGLIGSSLDAQPPC